MVNFSVTNQNRTSRGPGFERIGEAEQDYNLTIILGRRSKDMTSFYPLP